MNRSKCFFAICLLGQCPAHAAVEQIIETFDGDDFDNAGWEVEGDGTFQNGGYTVINEGGNIFKPMSDRLRRQIFGRGSFVSRVVLRDLDLGEITTFAPIDSTGWVSIRHDLGPNREDNITMDVVETFDEEPVWRVGAGAGEDRAVITVPRSNHLSMELAYDDVTRLVTFEYVDLSDAGTTYSALLDFQGNFEAAHELMIQFTGIDDGKANGILDHYELFPIPDIPGDFNGNGVLDSGDIDLLSQEVRDGTDERFFDANEDGVVDNLDRTFWVHDLANTFFGDANLDGEFNSGDLVAVFQAGQYEDGSAAGWAAGDWNGDAEFTSNDLVVAFQDGGYETGPRAAASAVPEPTAAMLMLIGLLAVARRCGLPCDKRARRADEPRAVLSRDLPAGWLDS